MSHNLPRSMAGFSLVELMVAVAIVGVLSTVAVVNYSNYVAKSRQSEAKNSLAAIYAAEKSFYSQYYHYVQGMADIGYSPAEQKRYYRVGWTAAGQAGSAGTKYWVTPSVPSYDRASYPAGWTTCTLAALSSTPGSAATSSTVMLVISTGQIRNGATGTCDTWQINQDKQLRQNNSGL